MSFFDPAPAYDGPIQAIADALEVATDEFVRAANVNAEAENAYLRAFRLAWLASDGVPATIRSKHCDQQYEVTEAKCAWNIADAVQKGCRQKCDELTNRLMAAMSWQKSVRAQT
jgi:hypothetical protein